MVEHLKKQKGLLEEEILRMQSAKKATMQQVGVGGACPRSLSFCCQNLRSRCRF